MPPRIAFLDRDGTIMEDGHYLRDPGEVRLIPNAARGLKRLKALGFVLLVVSNQSGVGRGYFGEDDVRAVNDRLQELLAAEGVELDGFYWCPHAPEDGCACRKPLPGLVHAVEAELAEAGRDFDPANCVVVGDKTCDVDLGRNVGALAVLVRTGKGAAHEQHDDCRPDLVADDLADAAEKIATAFAD